jgi:hypothetical protein
MKRPRTAAALLLLLPLSGCVFAVGTGDDEKADEMRDRIRAMERRLDRLERADVYLPAAAPTPPAPPAAPEPAR